MPKVPLIKELGSFCPNPHVHVRSPPHLVLNTTFTLNVLNQIFFFSALYEQRCNYLLYSAWTSASLGPDRSQIYWIFQTHETQYQNTKIMYIFLSKSLMWQFSFTQSGLVLNSLKDSNVQSCFNLFATNNIFNIVSPVLSFFIKDS